MFFPISSPIELVMVVNKDELSTLKIVPMISQVEQGGVMELWISDLVHVYMPILVVCCLGSNIVQTGKECGMGQVQLIPIKAKVFCHRVLYFALY